MERIILTRPAIEAGEKLGFLPGDLQSKIDPYLRPLYDALFDMLGAENFARCQERGDIEVAPLAYMRGRTLDNAYIILDEAQNTTPAQMKMFLTRLGFRSKMIITGDLESLASVAHTIYMKKAEFAKMKKSLPLTDQNLATFCERLLNEELAIALGIKLEKVPEYIEKHSK